ncbi:fungal-specific transcription factor domain-containing protein, partial [Mycena metata]
GLSCRIIPFFKLSAGDGNLVCGPCTADGFICTYGISSSRGERLLRSFTLGSDQVKLRRSEQAVYLTNLKLRLKAAEDALAGAQKNDSLNSQRLAKAIVRLGNPIPPADPDDAASVELADSFQALSLDHAPADPGFQGKSSVGMLVKVAVSAKPLYQRLLLTHRFAAPRPWTLKPWQDHSGALSHTLDFPPDDMMSSLVSLYFSSTNLRFLPLLHRPTFEGCIKQRLHLNDRGFATTLLLVCALGSLYLPSTSIPDPAFKWYDQVELSGLNQQPTLYDLQAYCLTAQFLYCTSNLRACWTAVVFGIRLAEDIGIHRARIQTPMSTPDEELKRRAMWILLIYDTQLGGMLGREFIMNQRDIDIPLPRECDDEHWNWQGPGPQPHNKPSSMAFFTTLIGLHRIAQFAFRALSRLFVNCKPLDHTAIAAGLHSALNMWYNQIPHHLTWEPDRPEGLFYDQAAALACLYYYTQITVHRRPLSANANRDPGEQSARERALR